MDESDKKILIEFAESNPYSLPELVARMKKEGTTATELINRLKKQKSKNISNF